MKVAKTMARTAAKKKCQMTTWQKVKRYKWIYLMLMPALLYFVIFRVTAIIGM